MKAIDYKLFVFVVAIILGASSCNDDEDTVLKVPVISTAEVTEITALSAISGGSITSDQGYGVTARGICWSTNATPTITDSITNDGAGGGDFTSNFSNLNAATTYFVRAYATNANGTGYGMALSFTTSNGLSSITTTEVASITAKTAICGGNITSDGGATISARGVVWGNSENPTIDSNQGITTNNSGIGSWDCTLSGLNPNTIYYVRAYATNSVGTVYGNQVSFTTSQGIISLTTLEIVNITATTASSGCNITSDGGDPITARGVVWSTSQNPTLTTNDGFTINGTGAGLCDSNLGELNPNTTYYVRAYATNAVETKYGNEFSFSTLFDMPDGPGSTVTDIEGNVYNTVWINGRQWFKENLKTTTLNDGTSIANVTDANAWCNLTTPAYCWNLNDISYKPIYGALYNWYTVNTDKLCPIGWHVATNDEWIALRNYVDPSITNAGTKLKATSGWVNEFGGPGNGTDNFGFSLVPSGFRPLGHGGAFGFAGWSAELWAAEAGSYPDQGLVWIFWGSSTQMSIGGDPKGNGAAVRCIRDLGN